MPSFTRKAQCAVSTNHNAPSAAERPVGALSDAPGEWKVMMEEIQQRLNLLEEKQTDTEATLQGLIAHSQEQNSRQQIQQETLDAMNTVSLANRSQRNMPTSSFRFEEGVSIDLYKMGAEEMYLFNASIWDVAIFIGTPSLGIGGSAISFMLLLMNVMIQVVFVGILWFNFSDASINETTIEYARRWRENFGHDYQHIDLRSGFSLVARVCNGDKSLVISSSQESLYQFVRDYLRPGTSGLEGFFVGQSLCTVALVCWFLMVSKELEKAVGLFRGTIFLDRGADRLVPVERPGHPTTLRVASISRTRMLFSAVIFGYRLILSGLLCYCGTVFLVYTIEITELVLNAVALDIVLNIDDLLYDAATTSSSKYLLLKLEPLDTPRWPHAKGADLKAAITAIFIPGAAMLVYHAMLSPMVDTLNKVAHALCGGTTNFVFAEDSLKMLLFATTQPCTNGCQMPLEASSSVQNLAVQEVVQNGRRNHSEYALWAGDYQNLRMRKLLSFEESVSQMTQGNCFDNLQGPYLHYMQQLIGNSSISDCNDVKQWCSSVSIVPAWGPDGGKGLMARMLCPRTCGCDNPGGGIALISGCPDSCMTRTDLVYAQHMSTSTHPACLQNSSITNSSDWKSWVAQIEDLSRFMMSLDFSKSRILFDYATAMRGGCDGLVDKRPAIECKWAADYTFFKGIAFFCPIACKCDDRNIPGSPVKECKDSCERWRSPSPAPQPNVKKTKQAKR